MNDADRELRAIADAQADPRRFGPLYQAYVDSVWRFAMSRLGSRDLANDATSQTFVRAIAALPRFRPERRGDTTTFGPWLMTIAHNVIADTARKNARRAGIDALEPLLPDHRPGPDQLAVSADEQRRVRDALATLPSAQRRIVEMRLDGASGQDIADALGMSVGAVKTAHYRAVRTLRQVLTDADEGRKSS